MASMRVPRSEVGRQRLQRRIDRNHARHRQVWRVYPDEDSMEACLTCVRAVYVGRIPTGWETCRKRRKRG